MFSAHAYWLIDILISLLGAGLFGGRHGGRPTQCPICAGVHDSSGTYLSVLVFVAILVFLFNVITERGSLSVFLELFVCGGTTSGSVPNQGLQPRSAEC